MSRRTLARLGVVVAGLAACGPRNELPLSAWNDARVVVDAQPAYGDRCPAWDCLTVTFEGLPVVADPRDDAERCPTMPDLASVFVRVDGREVGVQVVPGELRPGSFDLERSSNIFESDACIPPALQVHMGSVDECGDRREPPPVDIVVFGIAKDPDADVLHIRIDGPHEICDGGRSCTIR